MKTTIQSKIEKIILSAMSQTTYWVGTKLVDQDKNYAEAVAKMVALFQQEELRIKRETADQYEQAIEASFYDLKPNNDTHAYVQKMRARVKHLYPVSEK
jgi:Cu/Ag efflux pump CusA